MLSSSARLHRSAQIREVIRHGRRARAGELTVHFGVLAGRAGQPCAAAFVVPKRVGNAVTRNTVTRRLRHALRDRLAVLPEGSAVVVRVAPGADALSFTQLGACLDEGLARAGSRSRGRS